MYSYPYDENTAIPLPKAAPDVTGDVIASFQRIFEAVIGVVERDLVLDVSDRLMCALQALPIAAACVKLPGNVAENIGPGTVSEAVLQGE